MAQKKIPMYRFAGSACDWKNTDQAYSKKVLGGKGAALVLMAQMGLPVPPGFTIPCDVSNQFRDLAAGAKTQTTKLDAFVEDVMDAVWQNMIWLQDQFGYMPLVSVRSGAPESMPGMMDTILNVGLTGSTFEQWSNRIGARATHDSYRRLIQMLGATAYGIPHHEFDEALAQVKKELGVVEDTELDCPALVEVTHAYLEIFEKHIGHQFPDSLIGQLQAAVVAVFNSWMNPRAIEYRKLNKIPEDMGTAVNIQAMVFGNMGDTSGSGVLFTRNPSTGANVIMAEYLANAQGEDVVAGIRTPDSLVLDGSVTTEDCPGWMVDLIDVCAKLEDSYRDMVDVEFTVQEDKLFILQSRVGKRSALAAFQIAADLVAEGRIDEATALSRLKPAQYRIVKQVSVDPGYKKAAAYTGLPACPGVAVGRPVFTAADAVAAKDPVVLVTHETTPDDIAGMNAAKGILTQMGGATSHAAVVARAMDRPCVVGCTTLEMDEIKKAHRVTIDGATGRVWINDDVPVVDGAELPAIEAIKAMAARKTGDPVSTPVVDDALLDATQVIRAAAWWGDLRVLDATLAELAEDPATAAGRRVLDLRLPNYFEQPCALGGLLPAKDCKEFETALRTLLKAKSKELAGLSLYAPGLPSQVQTLYPAADDVVHHAYPIDTIVFRALGA